MLSRASVPAKDTFKSVRPNIKPEKASTIAKIQHAKTRQPCQSFVLLAKTRTAANAAGQRYTYHLQPIKSIKQKTIPNINSMAMPKNIVLVLDFFLLANLPHLTINIYLK
jgi:hypothetical protein